MNQRSSFPTVMLGLCSPWASLGEQRKWWLAGPCSCPSPSSRWKVSRQVRRVQRPHPASRAATGCLKMGTALPPGTRSRSDFSVQTGSRPVQEYTDTWWKKDIKHNLMMYQLNIGVLINFPFVVDSWCHNVNLHLLPILNLKMCMKPALYKLYYLL